MIWHNAFWMNRLSLVLVLVASALLLTNLIWRVVHRPEFSLQQMTITSDSSIGLQHISLADVRANLNGKIRGNFFTANLEQIRQAFLELAWVREVNVQRVWPNKLLVKIEEHSPVAVWKSADHSKLVNRQGEVFRVPMHDAEQWQRQQKALLYLSGPEGSSAEVMLRRAQIQAIFAPLHWQLNALELSPRYAWRAEFDNGVKIELGREENRPLLEERAQQFVQVFPKLVQKQSAKLVYADLRYPRGFAVRFQKEGDGVMTNKVRYQ